MLHSFSAPRDVADKALSLGFYLGFTGPITYKNADSLRSIAATMPLDRIVVETDGPFLALAHSTHNRPEQLEEATSLDVPEPFHFCALALWLEEQGSVDVHVG